MLHGRLHMPSRDQHRPTFRLVRNVTHRRMVSSSLCKGNIVLCNCSLVMTISPSVFRPENIIIAKYPLPYAWSILRFQPRNALAYGSQAQTRYATSRLSCCLLNTPSRSSVDLSTSHATFYQAASIRNLRRLTTFSNKAPGRLACVGLWYSDWLYRPSQLWPMGHIRSEWNCRKERQSMVSESDLSMVECEFIYSPCPRSSNNLTFHTKTDFPFRRLGSRSFLLVRF